MRDARIELDQGDTTSHDSNVGLVPLLHVSGSVVLAPRWRALLELEGIQNS